MKKCICLLLLLAMTVSLFTACAPAGKQQADQPFNQPDLPPAQNVGDKNTDATFESAYTDLAIALFQRSAAASREENLLISPLSIQLALAMTANGADGQTRQEMETLLGGIHLEELNAYLRTYVKELPSEQKAKLSIANSIWFRDEANRLTVEEDFLRTNRKYYDAEVFQRAFDETTVKEINNWVDHNTDGMIEQILDKIDDASMMYLINAMAFDAEWAEPYYETAIRDGSFTDISGKEQTVTVMHGGESAYLDDGRATGFLKPYAGGDYSFAVLLPNEGEDLYDYISSMTAQQLTNTLAGAEKVSVITQLPSFRYEFSRNMNDILKEMGMPTAFDPDKADLSKLGSFDDGNLFIGNVLHKTFVQVDGMGTKAGAVTMVEVYAGAAMAPAPEPKKVIVDRPFVYMIVDSDTNLPLFIGCVTEITE